MIISNAWYSINAYERAADRIKKKESPGAAERFSTGDSPQALYRSAFHAGIFSGVIVPADCDGQEGVDEKDIEGRSDTAEIGIGPAEDLRYEEGTVSPDGGCKAGDQRGLKGILEDIGNHAEGSTVDEAGREEEQHEGAEEEYEVMLLNAGKYED